MINMEDKENIQYLVEINLDKAVRESSLFFNSVCGDGKLRGKLINQTMESLYFELYNSKAIAIIPHSWIKWMAPERKDS